MCAPIHDAYLLEIKDIVKNNTRIIISHLKICFPDVLGKGLSLSLYIYIMCECVCVCVCVCVCLSVCFTVSVCMCASVCASEGGYVFVCFSIQGRCSDSSINSVFFFLLALTTPAYTVTYPVGEKAETSQIITMIYYKSQQHYQTASPEIVSLLQQQTKNTWRIDKLSTKQHCYETVSCSYISGQQHILVMWSHIIFNRVFITDCSILFCVLPLQELPFCQSPPTFSLLCYPCPYGFRYPHNFISPTFWSSNWSSQTIFLPDSNWFLFNFHTHTHARTPTHTHTKMAVWSVPHVKRNFIHMTLECTLWTRA